MTHRLKIRHIAATGLVFAAVAAGTMIAAGSASAATGKNGSLESGEFGLYYNSGLAGPVFDLFVEDTDFSNDHFPTASGIKVNDNTASYWNRDVYTWYVYTNANAGGIEGSLPVGYSGNASSNFKNEISSAYFYKAR